MSSDFLLIGLGSVLLTTVAVGIAIWLTKRRFSARLETLNDDLIAVSTDAAFGVRLSEKDNADLDDLGGSINQLFDTLGEREEQIRDRERLFSAFSRTLPEVVLIHDERILLANESAAALIGLDPEQLEGRDVTDLVKPAYRTLFRRTITRHMSDENVPRHLEIQLINGNDQGLWVESQSSKISYLGRPAILTIARDISQRKSVEATLGRSKRQAQYTLESLAEGVITTDNDASIDYMNRAAEKLVGVNRDDATGRKLGDILSLIDEADRRSLGDPVERCLAMRQRVNMGRRALLVGRASEHEHSVEISASPIRGPANEIAGAVVLFQDVSELRGLTRQMSYQATHDALTGLINRREFERRLQESMDAAQADEGNNVLCYLDLDRFKLVNDSCGHMAGDNMLREVATLIREQVRDSDFVARLGGDEFGTLLVGCPLEKARQIAEDTCRAVADYRFVWQDKIFNIGVSVGLVEIGNTNATMQDMLSAADSACYVAKRHGRGQVHVYSSRDEALARERGDIQWLQQLQNALKDDGFELALQSIISVRGDVESGPALEALLRLPDERGRPLSTAEFLKPAERYQLMPQIDRWVVTTCLTALGNGKIKLPAGRSLTINLSGQTLGDERFLEFVVECLDRTGVAPASICFEVAEQSVTANLQHAQRFIEVLHGMGCEFALDDFGSGLGAFSNLKHLPVDYLKIDGSFTHELMSDLVNQEMVAAMIKLARTMNFRVIAEQVEDQEDFDWLRDVGVDFVQGYFVEAPLPMGQNNRSELPASA